jgi:hypothetical protein
MPALPGDAAILIVHVLNPYGMAWLRRVNENNVDLNRNFFGPGEKVPRPPDAYEELDKLLNPTTPPSRDLFYLRAGRLVVRRGMRTLRQTVAGGQYFNPRGLFFGGKGLEQGPVKFQEYFAGRLASVERLLTIDIHTGLGRFGDDRLLVDAAPERIRVNQKMREVFGERVQLLDTRGVAFEVRGAQYSMYYRLLPRADVYFAAQEFGTYHALRVVAALRAENRWHHYGAGAVDHPTKAKLRDVFNPNDSGWRRLILQRGQEVIDQGLSLAFAPDSAGLYSTPNASSTLPILS